MKDRWLTAALGAGLAWAVVRHSWLVPGLASLVAARVVMHIGVARAGGGRHGPGPIVGFIGLSYLGLAYLVAAQIGRPPAARFWLIFFVGVAILGPVVLLAVRTFRR